MSSPLSAVINNSAGSASSAPLLTSKSPTLLVKVVGVITRLVELIAISAAASISIPPDAFDAFSLIAAASASSL